MSTTTPKVVVLKGDPKRYEALAGAAGILPGHLIKLSSTSGDVVVHNVAAGMAAPMFADVEDYAGGVVDTAYADNDQLSYVHCKQGDEIYALLPASAAAVVIGDYLESNGDGTLKKSTHATTSATTAAAWPIAIALQAIDNSGGGTAVRIKVRIL